MAKYQKYAKYKDSGVEWLENVPREWDIIKIKHLSTVKRGASPRPIDDPKYFDDNGEYAWVRIADVSASDMYLLNTTQTMSDLGSSLSVKLEPNQLFLSIAGTVGKPCINKIKACIHDGFVYFPELKIPNKYLFYVFAGEQAYKGLGKMGTQLNLNTDTVGDIKVALPKSQSDIYKIIEFLDHETTKIDHLIEKQQQLIELLKEKRQAVISHAVTKGLDPNVPMKDSGVEWLGKVPEHWNMAPVRRYLVEHRQGYYTTESYVDEGLKLLRITDLRDLGEINISNCPMVNESDTTHLFKLQKGDVVFARTGGAGSFGVITEDYENLIYASYLIRFRFMNKIFEPDYLRFLFQSDSFQLSVKQNIHGGVNQNIHAEDIKNTVICAPSLSEQKEIIEYLENQCLLFENLIYKASYSVKLMQERRTALISSTVTGKIDVRNWQAPTVAEADTELSA
ncbi:restriction endonuclease subunit S [Acinetobacter indicus]|uniref:restriction endonuclease subunit S n=1 Tax=Acinetobacter indicus TaxID=756892 RepID=UPI0009488A7D|nr:restriction endonuclease subunit S [Acinetobacter indicus]